MKRKSSEFINYNNTQSMMMMHLFMLNLLIIIFALEFSKSLVLEYFSIKSNYFK